MFEIATPHPSTRIKAGLLCTAVAASCALTHCAGEPTTTGLPAEAARVAFQSPCAQNAIECTTSWPTAVASVAVGAGQTVSVTESGFLIEAPWNWTGVPVQLVGDQSIPGDGATTLSYSWSYGATQDDPCAPMPGTEFATTPNPVAHLEPGLHYIRLSVRNDIIRDAVESSTCGVIGTNIASFDFVELEVEVRN